MPISRSSLPKEMDGKLRGAKPSRAMRKSKRTKKQTVLIGNGTIFTKHN